MQDVRRIVAGPAHLAGKLICIQGTVQEELGIQDVWTDPLGASNMAVVRYLAGHPPLSGTVYYGKVESLGYCVHEEWVE